MANYVPKTGTRMSGPLYAHTETPTADLELASKSYVDSVVGVSAAPATAQYVTLNTNSTLTQERVLTGTANQVTLTDNGAGGTIVISLPFNFPYAQGNVSGATTFNRANGDTITATLTGDITVTLTAGTYVGDRMKLILTQDGTGSRLVTWPSNFKKVGGTLTLSTAAGTVDMIGMTWDGTNWRELGRSLNLS